MYVSEFRSRKSEIDQTILSLLMMYNKTDQFCGFLNKK